MNKKLFVVLLIVTVLMMLFAVSAFALSTDGGAEVASRFSVVGNIVFEELASRFGVVHRVPGEAIASRFSVAG